MKSRNEMSPGPSGFVAMPRGLSRQFAPTPLGRAWEPQRRRASNYGVVRTSLLSGARPVRLDRYDGIIIAPRLLSGRYRAPLAGLHGLDRRQSALGDLYANRDVLVGCLR